MRHISSTSNSRSQMGPLPYSSHQSPPEQRPRSSRCHRLLKYVLFFGILVTIGSVLHSPDWSFSPSFFDAAITKKPVKAPSETGLSDSQLSKDVSDILNANSQYQIGVSLVNIASEQGRTFGTNVPFEAASTSKLLAACAFYHRVETGNADLNEPMGDYTAQFQLQEMINDSDNTSWQLIVNTIGDQQLQTYASSIGVDYDEWNNTLSPQAMATLLSKLYSGALLNKTDTDQLLSYMQNTNDEDLIPAALPRSVTVYHKYGLLNDELHDAGILVDGGKAYVLVIYTKSSDGIEVNDPRIDIIHELTKTVVTTLFPSSYSSP